MDQSSTASSSFRASYRSPSVTYDEGKTGALYANFQTGIQEIEEALNILQKDLINIQKDTSLTTKLIEKIESAKQNSNESISDE